MKKLFFASVAVAAGLLMVSCDKEPALNVATFEDVTVGNGGTNATFTAEQDGIHGWTSGEFAFTTGSAYSGTYFYNFIVSAQQENTYADFADQYHSAAGGAAEGNQFAVCFQDLFSEGAALEIKLTEPKTVPGCYLCNNAYAVASMENGDTYAKKFGNGDWFLLTITGYNTVKENEKVEYKETGKVEFYLADFRDGKSEIVKDWQYCDLSALGQVSKVSFTLTSSDNGDYGMNTPAYFCLDQFGAKK
ncbi:MAG: DUF4465 domain-containing protein [Paludibacteraceae bacterium]|nr:DUF4465 domain-containing protein [Paludibacteraceae bacterium]